MNCPNYSHPDFKLADEVFGRDIALVIYKQLGERIPTKKEIESMQRGTVLNRINNQRVWDVQNNEGIVTGFTTPVGAVQAEPVFKTYGQKKIADRLLELRTKYYGKSYTFGLRPDGKTIQVVDEMFSKTGIQQLKYITPKSAPSTETQSDTSNTVDESRKLDSNLQVKGNKEKALAQAAILQKAIPYVEQVIFDETIPIAQVDGGGRVIRLIFLEDAMANLVTIEMIRRNV